MAKIGVQKDRGQLYSDECLMLKRTLPCGAAAKLSIAHRLSFLGVIRDGKRCFGWRQDTTLAQDADLPEPFGR